MIIFHIEKNHHVHEIKCITLGLVSVTWHWRTVPRQQNLEELSWLLWTYNCSLLPRRMAWVSMCLLGILFLKHASRSLTWSQQLFDSLQESLTYFCNLWLYQRCTLVSSTLGGLAAHPEGKVRPFMMPTQHGQCIKGLGNAHHDHHNHHHHHEWMNEWINQSINQWWFINVWTKASLGLVTHASTKRR